MNIITDRKVEKMSNIDGSNSSSVREFQVWASMNHGAQLAADGKYGPLTKSAYAQWGAEWEKTQPAGTAKATTKKHTSKGVSEPTVDSKRSLSDLTNQSPTPAPPLKTSLPDKIKALSTPAKIGLGIGVLIFASATIWALIPKKKK